MDSSRRSVADLVAEESAAMEQGEDLTPEQLAGGVRRNRAKSHILTVRVNAEDMTEIEKAAADAGLPVSALVRGWILSGLAAHRGGAESLVQTVDRLAAEMAYLRERIGR